MMRDAFTQPRPATRLADVPVGTTVYICNRHMHLGAHGSAKYPRHSFLWESEAAQRRGEPFTVMAAGWAHSFRLGLGETPAEVVYV